MKTSTIVILACAATGSLLLAVLVCGGLAAFLTRSGGPDKVSVPVAKKELRQGTFIGAPEELFEVKEMARDLVTPDMILDVAKLRNRVLQRTVEAGSFVTRRDLVDEPAVPTKPGR